MVKDNIEVINEKDRNIIFSNHVFFPESVIVGDLFNYLKTISDLKGLLFISKTVYSSIGDRLKKIISIPNDALFTFDGEPTLELVDEYKKLVSERGYDYVLAIGGGSIIDLAKVVKNEVNISLVAVPTTPATGSETTPYSVFTDLKNKKKVVINSKKLLPEVVILDATFMNTINRRQMGYFIMDILAHSLEALVSRRANSLSDSFALESIRLVFENYRKLKEEYDKQALEKVLVAGFLGGLAQGMAAVGLIHAFAHNIGPKYGIKHSEAVSVFICPVIRLNMNKCDKYDKLNVLQEINKESILEGIGKIKKHFGIEGERIEVERGLNKDEDINLIKHDICAITNPVMAKDEELKRLLEDIFG